MKHITICICTYKRPLLLKRLLTEVASQETGGLFSYSILVVDNDRARSAEPVISDFRAHFPAPVQYFVETRQGIALARNKAVENAQGELVAFLDDDEFPTKRWLLTLVRALDEFQADGVLGPVKPHFDVEPPRWVVQGKFYERPSYPTGLVIDWKKGRTGNALLNRRIFAPDAMFRPEFRTGEDQDFFRRAIDKGNVFIWCNEAVAYEVVPPERWRRRFMLRRALLQGANSLLHPNLRARSTAKSAVAVVAYTALLPVALFLGEGRLMLCLLKLFDHTGRLLAAIGIDPIKEPYVTE